MKKFRNTFFFLIVVYVFTMAVLYVRGIYFNADFYFFSLGTILSLVLAIEIIYAYIINAEIHALGRNKEKLQLNLFDAEQETVLLSTLTDIIETFSEDITLEEVLDAITESLRQIFDKETIILQLLGDNFKKAVRGKDINIAHNIFEQTIVKSNPVLINNTSSFPQYKSLQQQSVTSFIVSPFRQKRNIAGIIGVFSFENKHFSIRELKLLRKVSATTSLLVENAVLLERTKTLAITDSLTQLYNRRHFEQKLTDIIEKRKGAEPAAISLCIADVDFFKHYNDLNGHQAGDVVLKTIADMLKQGVKGSDIVGRYGGEEFIIIFPDTGKKEAFKICDNIRQRVKKHQFPNEEAQPNENLTISFGVAAYPEDAENSDNLIQKADFALYRAKEMGKDQVCCC